MDINDKPVNIERALARMETADGSHRWMAYDSNTMIFMDNRKVVWKGSSAMGSPISIDEVKVQTFL